MLEVLSSLPSTIISLKRCFPENMAYIKKVAYEDVAHLVSSPEYLAEMQLAPEIYAVCNRYGRIVGLYPGYDEAVEQSLMDGLLRPYLLQ